MKTNVTLMLTVFVCVAALLMQTTSGKPFENHLGSLTEQERQEILHFAARIVRLAFKPADVDYVAQQQQAKRNSGMLDAVINMPDLFRAGRK